MKFGTMIGRVRSVIKQFSRKSHLTKEKYSIIAEPYLPVTKNGDKYTCIYMYIYVGLLLIHTQTHTNKCYYFNNNVVIVL